MDTSACISQLTELKNQLQSVEEKIRTDTESLLDQLRHLSCENDSIKLENQRLKVFDYCFFILLLLSLLLLKYSFPKTFLGSVDDI